MEQRRVHQVERLLAAAAKRERVRIDEFPIPRRDEVVGVALRAGSLRGLAVRLRAKRARRSALAAALRDQGGGLGASALGLVLVIRQLQQARDVGRDLGAGLRGVERSLAVGVARVRVGSRAQEDGDRVRAAHKRRAMQRRGAVAVARLYVGATPQEGVRRLGPPLQRRPRQGRHAERGVGGVRVGSRRQGRVQHRRIARRRREPNVPFGGLGCAGVFGGGFSERRRGVGRRVGHRVNDDVHRGDDGEGGDQEGQEHAHRPLPEHGAQPALFPQHRREEAAH